MGGKVNHDITVQYFLNFLCSVCRSCLGRSLPFFSDHLTKLKVVGGEIARGGKRQTEIALSIRKGHCVHGHSQAVKALRGALGTGQVLVQEGS